MSLLRKIPWYVRTALIVTAISLLPVSIFFFFHYSEMRPQWEAEALEAYEQGVTSVSKDLANTIDELKLKSDFLLDSTVIQNAVLHVDTYSLVESLSFIHELTDVMDAITLENPYISLRFYPERCAYSLGSFCKSFDRFYSDYGETPILQETLLTIPNRSSLLVLRADPDTDEPILALCSRLQLFGGAGAVLELSVPIEQIVSIPETLPAEAELQLLLTNETYETTPVILQRSNLQTDEDCLVLRRNVGKHTDLEITCSLPRQNIQLAVNRGSTVTFGLLIVLMVAVFFVSLITARLFYVRMLLLINNIGDKVDGVLHGSPVESKSTSDLKLLEEKIYQLVDQTKLYYETNLQYAETQQHMELELLQMRFNPHFLYNTLNTLRFRARNPAIQRVVDSLVQYYRIVLNKGDLIICLKDEMTLIEEYLKIEQFAYSINNMTWEIYLDPEVANCAVIKHILQPIVENALFHGVRMNSDGGIIRISAKKELDDIKITIEDTGPGMDTAQIAKLLDGQKNTSEGYGISNVQQRIRLFYGASYGLNIQSELGTGTRAILRIPMIPHTPKDTERRSTNVSGNDC